MIEFQVASWFQNREEVDFWQGLNAASVALQQAAQSETAVYQVFSEQLTKLGLHGSISLLDESGENLHIESIVFSQRLRQVVDQAEKTLKIDALGFTYAVSDVPAETVVLSKGSIIFLPDNTEKMLQVIPPNIYRFAKPFLKPLIHIPAILAPIFAQSKVVGILYLAGAGLQQEDVPAIGAFATHLSIALDNARLFQAVQQAETQYRILFESANDGIFLFDPETRLIVSANSKMQSLLGWEPSEITAMRPSEFAPPSIGQRYLEHLETAMQKGQHFFEVPFKDKNGQLHQWQISTTVIMMNGRSFLNGVVRDITEAKQAEMALRQREEQFRVLAENVPGTIYSCKNERNYPLLYINDNVETLTGYAKEKFLQKEVTFNSLIHPEDKAASGFLLDNMAIEPNETFHYIYRIQHRLGHWHWVEDVGGGVFDEAGNMLFLEGIISDITERVQSDLLQKTVYHIAEVANTNVSLDELYCSIHETLAQILDVNNFYIALYDEPSNTIDVPYFVDENDTITGRYQASNGLTELVVQSNSAYLLTRQQIEARVAEGSLLLRGTLPQVWLGVPLRTRDQAVGALVVQGYEASSTYSEQDRRFLIFVSEQIANAIERKQAEERQRKLSAEITQQTRLLEAILAATPDIFLVFDVNGRIQFISNAILEYLGMTLDLAVGKSWTELDLPESFDVLNEQDWLEVLQTGRPITREFVFPVPGGDREIELITSLVRGADGEANAFVNTARDITERKQTMRAMYRSQKMESLGILAGGIAHDFNNLLVAILGQASLAQAKLAETDPAYKHMNKAVQAAEQAASLTRQLLAYSGGGQFTTQPVALNVLLTESVDLLRVALPKQVTLTLSLAPNLPQIEADMTQIQQVVMNLIINAAEAMGDRLGEIWVQTAVCHITAKDQHYWRYTDYPLTQNKFVKLSIKDSGAGMNEETVAKIFDPFFTTKFTGRGLGLAAVLGIIRGHKGGLHVQSVPQQGTTFDLLFPIAANRVETFAKELENVKMSSKGLVLVIDDEKAVREAVADILEMEEVGVLTAANGDEGISMYKENAATIDLVLLDLSMPGKSGQETFEELKEVDPDVRILLSSGYNEDSATRGFASPPLVGFLQKPYRLDTFVHRLNEYL